MKPFKGPSRLLAALILLTLSLPGLHALRAQTLIFSENFDSWQNGLPNGNPGWESQTNTNCQAGSSCYWNDFAAFPAGSLPAPTGCEASFGYARCNSSQLTNIDYPSLVSPVMDLSGFPLNDSITVSFCMINPSLSQNDADGLLVFFSPDSGLNWFPQFITQNIFTQWTPFSIAVGSIFRTSQFRIKIEGFGNASSLDIGFDQLKVTNLTPVCQAANSSIQAQGPLEACLSDTGEDLVYFSRLGSPQSQYAYLVTDPLNVLVRVLPDSFANLQDFMPGEYRVHGIAYTGSLNASPGFPLSSITGSVCQINSVNFLEIEVRELATNIQADTLYNGFGISEFGGQNGQASVSVSGGSGQYDIQWNSQPPQSGLTATNLPEGEYTVLIEDTVLGCTQSLDIKLNQPPKLNISLGSRKDYQGRDISCHQAADGSIGAEISGGVAPYSLIWNHAPGLQDTLLDNLAAGTYGLIITDANGATQTASISLVAPAPLEGNIDILKASCFQQNDGVLQAFVRGGTGPFSLDWGAGGSDWKEEKLAPGIQFCLLTDANGCQISLSQIVPELPEITVDIFTEDPPCANEPGGFLSAQVSGGSPPFTYQWAHGPTTEELYDVAAGEYALSVQDEAGCQVSQVASLTAPTPMSLSSTIRPDEGTGTGAIEVEISGGTPPYTYQWDQGDTTAILRNLRAGNYTLEVMDDAGCVLKESLEVLPPEDLTCLKLHMGFTPNGDGINETWEIPCIDYFPQNNLSIVNRWGQLIYEVADYDNSWDGTISGRALPDGTYYYIFKATVSGIPRTFKGTISILR
ncbi:MAG: gliding motility-associated C-terminal domain-containing protein [Bacteroidota bacterium]